MVRLNNRAFEILRAEVQFSGGARTGTFIAAAEQFAIAASVAAKNPPYTASEWSEIAGLWEQAIHELKLVPLEDPGYVEAQKLQANYQRNLVQPGTTAYPQAQELLASAQKKLEQLQPQ